MLDGVKLLKPHVHRDERGTLVQAFRYPDDIPEPIVQGNTSTSRYGVIRGLHYQPYAQGRLVRCARGAIWDVVVDMREGSETAGQAFQTRLDSHECHAVWVPAGFAHGFQVLSGRAHVVYEFAAANDPETMLGVRYDDPALGLVWPVMLPTVSEKDQTAPLFRDAQKVRL